MLLGPLAARASVVVALAFGVAACGSDEKTDETSGATPAAQTKTAAEPTVGYSDGTVTGVTPTELRLLTTAGEESFVIDEAVERVLGLGHIASHAGTGIGFRIHYTERDGTRYLLRGEELGSTP